MDKFACNSSIKNHNLTVLHWLCEHKCPWDHEAYTYANWIGNVNVREEILQYLRDNGCPEI